DGGPELTKHVAVVEARPERGEDAFAAAAADGAPVVALLDAPYDVGQRSVEEVVLVPVLGVGDAAAVRVGVGGQAATFEVRRASAAAAAVRGLVAGSEHAPSAGFRTARSAATDADALPLAFALTFARVVARAAARLARPTQLAEQVVVELERLAVVVVATEDVGGTGHGQARLQQFLHGEVAGGVGGAGVVLLALVGVSQDDADGLEEQQLGER